MVCTLVVDNGALFRRALKLVLSRHFPDLLVIETSRGDNLLEKIDSCLPDLILMDVHLQGKNGLELTKEIKEAYPNIPVAIVTNYDLNEYRAKAYENGADRFIPKGVLTTDDIVALVKPVVLKARRRQAPASAPSVA